jgi:hypothetical protein
MQCSNFFQPFIDWLNQPTDPGSRNTVDFLVAGNRSEANRFCLYMTGSLIKANDAQLSATTPPAQAFFSDRVAANNQPFNENQTEPVNVTLSLPNGPLVFSNPHTGALGAQFSTLECRDNGLLVCTSDFDRSILVISFRNGNQLLIQ